MNEEQLNVEKLVERVLEHMRNDVGSVEFDKLAYLGNLEKKVRRRMMTKGLITQPFADKPHLKTLTEYGWSFTTFEQERTDRKNKEKLERDQSQSVIDTNNSVKKTNYITWINVFVSIVFSIVVTTIQIKSCNRENFKSLHEEHKLMIDSIKSAQQSIRDSIFQNKILQLLKHERDSLKK